MRNNLKPPPPSTNDCKPQLLFLVCPPGMVPLGMECYGVLQANGNMRRNQFSCSNAAGAGLASLLNPQVRQTIANVMKMQR